MEDHGGHRLNLLSGQAMAVRDERGLDERGTALPGVDVVDVHHCGAASPRFVALPSVTGR
jgi:hypothetical protein